MTNKKIIATTAMAALAFPAAAAADKPAHPGAHGKSKAAEKKATKKKTHRQLTLSGVDLTKLVVTDGKLTAPFEVDPTAVNRYARTFLQLSKADVKGDKTVTLGVAGDAVRLRYRGLTATDAILPTDKVKVVGKVRNGALDISKITVSRPDADADTDTDTDKDTDKS